MLSDFKNPFTILSEACKHECDSEDCDHEHDYRDDHDDDELELEESSSEKKAAEKELEDELEDTEEMDDDVQLTAEMVNLFYDGRRYYIEAGDLADVMDDEDIDDPEEALDTIKDANKLDASAVIAVMIESKDVLRDYIEEAKAAKKGGKKNATLKLKDSSNFLKNLKNKGIVVVSKKKKKKKGSKK